MSHRPSGDGGNVRAAYNVKYYRASKLSSPVRCANVPLQILPFTKMPGLDAMTIFQKIIDRQIPADIIYEDSDCVAFRDIHPQAPTHVLIIPRKPIPSLAQATIEDQALLGHLLLVAAKLAVQLQLPDGFRTVLNCGRDGGQTVDHLHVHLLGGRSLGWPPG